MLDIFRSDAFSVTSLTEAVLKAPYKPGRIGALGLFIEKGIRTTSAVIEEKDGRIALIQTSPRGGPGSTIGEQKRKARAFVVPHLERNSSIQADEVQNVRAFGSEDATVAVQALVGERLADLRSMHEVTLEHMRAKALQGQVLDADGTVLLDLFTAFDVAQQTYDIDLASPDLRGDCVHIQRLSERALGAEPISGYRALCGDAFFDAFIRADAVVESLKFQESALLRTDVRSGFEYGGITFENYRGRVAAAQPADIETAEADATPFFADDEAYVVPIGPSIFRTYFAPADFVEAVNTLGLPIYAKQFADPELNRFVKIHTQSNPLVLCTRPRAVIKLTIGS